MGVLVAIEQAGPAGRMREPDLFGWRALAEKRRLRADPGKRSDAVRTRATKSPRVARIASLPVHSHRRVVLEVRLQMLVVEILKLEQRGSDADQT